MTTQRCTDSHLVTVQLQNASLQQVQRQITVLLRHGHRVYKFHAARCRDGLTSCPSGPVRLQHSALATGHSLDFFRRRRRPALGSGDLRALLAGLPPALAPTL